MILQIYGVKILANGERERRYYGDTEESDADDALHSVISTGCDYAYAKQIGMGDAVKYLARGCGYVESKIQMQEGKKMTSGGLFNIHTTEKKQPS